MNSKANLWIITELFHPNETSTAFYLTEIAKHFSESHNVNVICGGKNYEENSKIYSDHNKLPQNINVHRLKTFNLDKNVLLFRIIKMFFLSISISIKIILNVKKSDYVWIVTNPALLIPFVSFICIFKKFHYTILVHDIFPENLIPSNILKPTNIVYKLLKQIYDMSFSKANKIIVCGRDMKELMEKKVGKLNSCQIDIIENWADVDSVIPNSNTKSRSIYGNIDVDDTKIILQFAGNLGRLQGLIELIQIIKKVDNPNVLFVFIGEGALKKMLVQLSKEIKNIVLLPSFPRNMQSSFLSACDIGIVSLNDSMYGIGVPSKSYNILAANKPILFLGNKNSEISKMVLENNVGWSFEFTEAQNILEFFNKLNKSNLEISQKYRDLAENKYSKKIILNKYSQLLNKK